MKTQSLLEEIEKIKKRNGKVEANKAWETSWTRKISIVVTTYIIATCTFLVIHNPQPFINALVPTIGFFLSTLSLPFMRRYWERYIYQTEDEISPGKTLTKAQKRIKLAQH